MKLFVVIATLLLFLPGCSKNKNHPIASIPFDFQIDLSLPSYQDLNGVGGWAYVNGGIKGIIVYRQ
ncbi:MAG: hypothetical protein KA394_03620, partial [Fluviicola sp.]|nr:hypothetical protein [Fluviicola sp.]